jgi:hypothetical protein
MHHSKLKTAKKSKGKAWSGKFRSGSALLRWERKIVNKIIRRICDQLDMLSNNKDRISMEVWIQLRRAYLR